jgi:hypothetical protein
MLQRQGVGYLDDTVAVLASASADRFLATVLQQAVACRNQRLKGAELLREETRQRRKHILEYKEETYDRKRRKIEREEDDMKANLAAIEAAKNVKKGASKADGPVPVDGKSKKRKMPDMANGHVKKRKIAGEDGDSTDDSIDNEERYYQKYYDEDDNLLDDENEEEEEEHDNMVVLRDLQRPLEAWDFTLTGKVGLGLVLTEKEERAKEDVDEQGQEDDVGEDPTENGDAADEDSARSKSPPAPSLKKAQKSPPSDGKKSKSRGSTPTPATVPPPKGKKGG